MNKEEINKRILIYQKIKSEYMSEFSLVLSSKSKMCDIIVLGIDKDIFIKIIYENDNIDIDNLIKRTKNKIIWRNILKSEYIFYIYDSNYKFIEKKIINI